MRAAKAAASAPPKQDFGHVDLVVARAVAEGVISRFEADLIVTTRLDGRSLIDVGEALGMTANALRMRRRKAEARLAAWLTGADQGGADGGRGQMGEVGENEDRFTAVARISGPRQRCAASLLNRVLGGPISRVRPASSTATSQRNAIRHLAVLRDTDPVVVAAPGAESALAGAVPTRRAGWADSRTAISAAAVVAAVRTPAPYRVYLRASILLHTRPR